MAAYAGSDLIPLHVDPKAIRPEAPLQSNLDPKLRSAFRWQDRCVPRDDYIGNLIVWDKSVLHDITLCRTRAFSEYLLYGHFVGRSPTHWTTHPPTPESPATSYWESAPLDSTALAVVVGKAQAAKPIHSSGCAEKSTHSVLRNVLRLSFSVRITRFRKKQGI